MSDLETLGRKFREAVAQAKLVQFEEGAELTMVHGYIRTALENLHCMKDEVVLSQVRDEWTVAHKKWVITKGYYAMFHAALALLANKGWKSKDHESVPVALELLYCYPRKQKRKPDAAILKRVSEIAFLLDSARGVRGKMSYQIYPDERDVNEGVDLVLKNAERVIEIVREIVARTGGGLQ